MIIIINMPGKRVCAQACSCDCGRRCSTRRHAVKTALAAAGRHVAAEEVHRLARRLEPGIGIATVYRALNCLCGCGKARELKTPDGSAVYEAASAAAHAHLVCSGCGAILQASSPGLERLAAALARRSGFSPSGSVEVRGLCSNCSKRGKI